MDESGSLFALGSCKWADSTTKNHEHPTAELDKLEMIRDHLKAPNAKLFFFDRVGLSRRLHEFAAARSNVELVLAEDMRPRSLAGQ